MSPLGYLEPVRIILINPLVRSSRIILSSLYNKSSSHLQTKIGLNQPTNSNYRLYGFGHCLETKLLNILLANCSDNPATIFKIISLHVFLSHCAVSFKIQGVIFSPLPHYIILVQDYLPFLSPICTSEDC